MTFVRRLKTSSQQSTPLRTVSLLGVPTSARALLPPLPHPRGPAAPGAHLTCMDITRPAPAGVWRAGSCPSHAVGRGPGLHKGSPQGDPALCDHKGSPGISGRSGVYGLR